MDTCAIYKVKGKCQNRGNWNFSLNFAIKKKKIRTVSAASFSEAKQLRADNTSANQFSFTMGLGYETKLKSRLSLFSFIHIQCHHIFCFWFHNLPTSSKCCQFLGSGPQLTDWKISLINLARFAISVSE